MLVESVKVKRASFGIKAPADVADTSLGLVVLEVGRKVRLHFEFLSAVQALVIIFISVLADEVDLQIRLCFRLEVAQTAGEIFQGLAVSLHVFAQIHRAFKALEASFALVGPRDTVLQHVRAKLAL